jgi:membrane protease YdiL (CAAX protease family)
MKDISENQFLTLYTKGKNSWWTFVTFVSLLAGLLFISYSITEIDLSDINQTVQGEGAYGTAVDMAKEGFAFLLVLIGIFFGIRIIHKRDFATLNYVDCFSPNEVLEGILVWGTLVMVGSLINQQDQWKYFLDNEVNVSLLYMIPIVILSIGIQSYTEEVIFRGYLLQSLFFRIKNYYLLILVSSSIFGVLHAAYGLEAMLGVTLFGILHCFIVINRKSLAFVSGVHFINNFFFVYILAGDENAMGDKDFMEFDFVSVGIDLIQFLLLFFYIKFRQKTKTGRSESIMFSQ